MPGRRSWVPAALAASEQAGEMTTFLAADGQVLGFFELADEIRPEAREALEALRAGGITRVLLVTGDRAEVAHAVGAPSLPSMRSSPTPRLRPSSRWCAGKRPMVRP
jgi:P-type E1-E2 ATPase